MKRYKVKWNCSNLSISENPQLLERHRETKWLENLTKEVKKDSRFDKYSDLTKWFYLNGLKIQRIDPSSNKYIPEIKFSPCYFEPSEKLQRIIRRGITAKPKIREQHSQLEKKIRNDARLPITSVIECCEILNQDFWKLVEGEKLGGKTSSKSITVPKETPKLEKLVAWVLTEGHIPLSHPSIEINQIKSAELALKTLAHDIEEIFNSEDIVKFSSTKSWSGEDGERLLVSSSAVRQFMVLKYRIPLGKKSRKINWDIPITKKNYRELLSCFIQTEGSIYSSNGQVKFEFKIQDKCIRDCCYSCLKRIDCNPQKSKTRKTFNTGTYSFEGILKLHKFAKHEIKDDKLAHKIRTEIQDSNLLSGLRNLDWCPLVEDARKALKSDSKNKAFSKIHNKLFPENSIEDYNVSNWALHKHAPPLSAAITAIHLTSKTSEDVFPDYLNSYINSSSLEKHV